MPKALFFSVPGHGHVNPSLPLVAELSRRGHRITYFVTEGYRGGVEAAGAAFRPYPFVNDDYFDAQGLSGSVPLRVAHALISTSAEILPDLLDIARAEQPDYILFDGMCPWGSLVARVIQRPSVASLALAPVVSMPPGVLLKLSPLILPFILKDFGIGFDTYRQANRLTRKYNLPSFTLMGIMNNLGDLSISYTSSEFQPYSATADPSVRFVGWTLHESLNNGQFSFERLHGRRLIYVSLGTLNNDDMAFFEACIEAFGGSDSFVIMTTGRRISPESFGVLPENIAIYGWVPQVEVLKRASLFISHGGLNSIHDSLYLGVPLLLVPQQAEQTLNALRVVELGAGLMLKKRQVNPQTLRSHAARLLSESHFRVQARKIGDTFRAAGGVVRAADEIENLLKKL